MSTGRSKSKNPGTIQDQPEHYTVETSEIPISCDRVDGPHCSDINQRNQIHDWEEIRGKTPRHGAIAKFVK